MSQSRFYGLFSFWQKGCKFNIANQIIERDKKKSSLTSPLRPSDLNYFNRWLFSSLPPPPRMKKIYILYVFRKQIKELTGFIVNFASRPGGGGMGEGADGSFMVKCSKLHLTNTFRRICWFKEIKTCMFCILFIWQIHY